MTNKHHDDTIDTNDTEETIVVKVQRMFPNCQKYTKCCVDSGTEEMMNRVDEETKKAVKEILEEARKKK